MPKEPTISRSELDLRLRRIKEYNAYQMQAGQPHHRTTRRELEEALRQWGYDTKLAEGITHDPLPSPILEEIKARNAR